MASIDFSTITQLDSQFHVACGTKEIYLSELDGMNYADVFSDFGINDPELLCIMAEEQAFLDKLTK
jgi:hypothetical protein